VSAPVWWVFGYGSLVWRPAFDFVERREGIVHGWARKFWQASTDHRGVPEAPGRVVTVHREPGARCHGVAYAVPEAQRAVVVRLLDHREQGGYERHEVAVETARGRIDGAVMYVAGPGNPSYVGPRSLAEIADVVVRSQGPSGDNVEYVLRLAEALRAMRADDDHVFALADLLRARVRP
jgi:glutathione-specific gamma-glutamylcyclotransferase